MFDFKSRHLGAVAVCSCVAFASTTDRAEAFSYIFAGETNGVDIVTHSLGYAGIGGLLSLTVGINPTSLFATEMAVSVANVVNTWNQLTPTTGNLVTSPSAPPGSFDFETTLLHEVGHSLGLGHVNAASESGLSGADQNYTKATVGANFVFDINPGLDGVIGSGDDLRGDDQNLHYFRKADNDPFDTGLGVVDSTTYSRDLADLPGVDTFSANGDRAVGALLGYSNTESVMQQGTFAQELQRTLVADDVAGILYAQTGLDEIAGTVDDYSVYLDFVGEDAGADMLIGFDNSQTGFAVSQSSGGFIGATDHVGITSTNIFFNSGVSWDFNDTLTAVPLPAPVLLLGSGLAGLGLMRRRKARKG